MPTKSSSDSRTPRRKAGPLWLRFLVGDRVARRTDAGSLPFLSLVSLLWWRLGLTPTARYRQTRFRQSMLDDRGPTFSVRIARQSAPPNG